MIKNLNLIDSKLSITNKIAILTFCRNDIRNALTGSYLIDDIINTINYVNKNNKISVLIITGEGKAFSSGGNVKEMLKFYEITNGRDTRNSEPLPILLLIAINPRLLFKICFTMESPKPVPLTPRDRATSVR